MVRLCLSEPAGARTAEAFQYVERAKSRVLLDLLGGAFDPRIEPRDAFEAQLLVRIETLRDELNALYSQFNQPRDGGSSDRGLASASLEGAVREREDSVLNLSRQIEQRRSRSLIQQEPIDDANLRQELAGHSALVEYFSLDDELLAFVVTGDGVSVTRRLGSLSEIEQMATQFRFQIATLRYGSNRIRTHLDQLTARARHYLQALYRQLLAPIADQLGERRLVIVPHRRLHYLPFHALDDGQQFVIERREVCYVPNAGILRYCLAAPRRPLDRALLAGVADAQTPRVLDELAAIAPLFPDRTVLLGEQATLPALVEGVAGAGVVHLACHGVFRPDNPLFSALRIGDGWLTVRDAYQLPLTCNLVTLSACETGMSEIAPGDELVGLARGFFAAGAPSLLVSLWPVDDNATAELMSRFYTLLLDGHGPAAALRLAQTEALHQYGHPFFWSPFMLMGSW